MKKLEKLKSNQLSKDALQRLSGGHLTYATIRTLHPGGESPDTSAVDDSGGDRPYHTC